MNRTNPPPLSFPQGIEKMKLPGREGNAAVVAETVTDEVRVQEAPKLRVPALHGKSGTRASRLEARSSPSTRWPRTPPSAMDHPALRASQRPGGASISGDTVNPQGTPSPANTGKIQGR